jgi:putative PIN family toxin of toxin-antitoxin system
LRLIASGAEWFRPTETIEDCRNPKDNKFLELAITSSANLLITGDQNLLVLHPYRGIKVLTIAEV